MARHRQVPVQSVQNKRLDVGGIGLHDWPPPPAARLASSPGRHYYHYTAFFAVTRRRSERDIAPQLSRNEARAAGKIITGERFKSGAVVPPLLPRVPARRPSSRC